VPVADLGRRFEDAGVAALLFTDVGRDGLLKGVNIEATAELAKAVKLPVIASGGLAELAEIRALRLKKGISGVIAGRSLYDGRIDLKAALAAAA
jgi:phosphoribosylformimino-5-aminoimidazole carboxamide ribotide isomerase